jgi:hypothetical protein
MGKITSIKRLAENGYFVQTDTAMSDGSFKADTVRFTEERTMRSVPGFRVGFPITIKLSEEKTATVRSLAIGETALF